MRPVWRSRPRRGPRARTSSDPNRRIFRVLPAARPSAARWKMVSTIRRASARVTPPWRLRTVAARSALFNVETRSFLPFITGGEDSGNCTAVGGGGRLQPGRRATAGGRCSAGSVARSAAKGVYQVAVRMTRNTGVPAERRTTTELRVLPCRPPAAGGAGGRRAVPAGGAPGTRRWCGTYVGMAQGHRRWFRAPARCRSEGPHRENCPALRSRALHAGWRCTLSLVRATGVIGDTRSPLSRAICARWAVRGFRCRAR